MPRDENKPSDRLCGPKAPLPVYGHPPTPARAPTTATGACITGFDPHEGEPAMAPTLADVVDKLQTLGSADQIAAFFAQEGVTGSVRRVRSCPVAAYVKRETGLVEVLATRGFVVDWHTQDGVPCRDTPVSDFIARFDDGAYDELVR